VLHPDAGKLASTRFFSGPRHGVDNETDGGIFPGNELKKKTMAGNGGFPAKTTGEKGMAKWNVLSEGFNRRRNGSLGRDNAR